MVTERWIHSFYVLVGLGNGTSRITNTTVTEYVTSVDLGISTSISISCTYDRDQETKKMEVRSQLSGQVECACGIPTDNSY